MMRFVITQEGHEGEKAQGKNIRKRVQISTFYSRSVTSDLLTIAVNHCRLDLFISQKTQDFL